MLYNQEQRQLIIWEQKDSVKHVISMLLLVSLGSKILRRELHRKFMSLIKVDLSADSVISNSETFVQN